MQFMSAAYTDIGISKKTNQDSFAIKIAETSVGTVVMALICDGMGGLAKGEVASAEVVKVFVDWFDRELPSLLLNPIDDIKYRWEQIIKEQNQRIAEYGKSINVSLGTTLTICLFVDENYLLVGHVGDTRLYKINSSSEMLTTDQTVINREIMRGNLSKEDAQNDPRRNVLLQCIGASKIVEPDFILYGVEKHSTYMLCCDGFRHLITDEEIYNAFNPFVLSDENVMQLNCKALVELNKERLENDNITVIVLKTL